MFFSNMFCLKKKLGSEKVIDIGLLLNLDFIQHLAMKKIVFSKSHSATAILKRIKNTHQN